MRVYTDLSLLGIGFVLTPEIFVIRIGKYLFEIYNKNEDKYYL
jgi:hypothetical protein